MSVQKNKTFLGSSALLVSAALKRGRIIVITAASDDAANEVLEAFVNGNIDMDEDDDATDANNLSDDGLLADDGD